MSDTSDTGTTNDASGATFTGTGVTTFSSITTLQTEFDVTDDDCRAGSPRFQVRVQTPSGEKNVFVYLGPTPSFTGCSQNVWIVSGNLIGSTDGRVRDEPDPARDAGLDVRAGARARRLVPVTGISLVVDSSFAFTDKEQTVRIRNVKINASTFYTGDDALRRRTAAGSTRRRRARSCARRWVPTAFRAAYGTNANGANAFGKCVSAMARMKTDAARSTAVERIETAADRCTKLAVAAKKGKGKAKGHAKQGSRVACLKKSV